MRQGQLAAAPTVVHDAGDGRNQRFHWRYPQRLHLPAERQQCHRGLGPGRLAEERNDVVLIALGPEHASALVLSVVGRRRFVHCRG